MNALTHLNIARAANGLPVYRIPHEPHTDHMCDAWDCTDAFVEASGDSDKSAAMYFDHNNDFGQYNPVCVGLSVTEGDETFFYTSEGAIALMGVDAVNLCEQQYSDEVNG